MVTHGAQRTARPAVLVALAAVLVSGVLGGCARAVTGTPTVNEAAAAEVRAEVKQKRDCEAARVDLTTSITDALKQAESDFAGGARALTTLLSSSAPRDFGSTCGTELVGPAYSQMLIDVQAVPLTGSSATILRSSLLRGLCPSRGAIELTPEAQQVCATAR